MKRSPDVTRMRAGCKQMPRWRGIWRSRASIYHRGLPSAQECVDAPVTESSVTKPKPPPTPEPPVIAAPAAKTGEPASAKPRIDARADA
jgi:hypothetical protein